MDFCFNIAKCIVEIFLKIFCGENSNDIKQENKLKREKLKYAAAELEKTRQGLEEWKKEILENWHQQS